MSEPVQAHKREPASIKLNGGEARIEKILSKENEGELIRLSVWSQGEIEAAFTLPEKELITLLQAGIRAGILAHNFASELRKVTEI